MYLNKYYIPFSNDIGEFIEIYLDYLDYDGISYTLIANGDCFNDKATSGDENKIESIIGREVSIKINVMPGDNVTLQDITAAHDLDIRVRIYLNRKYDRSIFEGFVVVEDNNQPLLDPPFVLQVRALDGLGFLKGVNFADTNGNPFLGKMNIIGWLSQVLAKTGQDLRLRTYFNLYHSSFVQNKNALEQIFLDITTFATGQQNAAGDTDPNDFNTGFDDFYTVLEKIVRNFRCKLFQENGAWHLVSLWEYLNPNGYAYYEYQFADPVDGIIPYTITSSASGIAYDVPVGKRQIPMPVSEDALLYLKLATKSFELTYNYDQSLNKICNQNLRQGAADPADNEVISSTIIDPTINGGVAVNLNTFAYQSFCFDLFDGDNSTGTNPFPSTPQLPATGKSFIRQVQDELSYDLVRFLVMTAPSTSHAAYLRSSRILIDNGDIFQLSFSWRTRTATTPGTVGAVAVVFLYGDDGSLWSLRSASDGTLPGNPTEWRVAPSPGTNWLVTGGLVQDSTQWQAVAANQTHLPTDSFAKVPVAGQIEIILAYPFSALGGTEYWFKDISVTILPFLQGAYKQLKGDYNYSLSNNNIRQTSADVVQISDSPKRYFKGALVDSVTGLSLLTPQWARKGFAEAYRFTQLGEYLIYSHLFRQLYKVEGTFKGFVYIQPDDLSLVRPIGILNSYYFVDTNNPTKRYMCTSFDRNWNTGQWRGVFVETLADINDPGLSIPDSFIFAYLFQDA